MFWSSVKEAPWREEMRALERRLDTVERILKQQTCEHNHPEVRWFGSVKYVECADCGAVLNGWKGEGGVNEYMANHHKKLAKEYGKAAEEDNG